MTGATARPRARACAAAARGLTVALVGDSHAQQWEPALARLAGRHDLTVVRATRGGCAPNDTLVDRDEDIRGVTARARSAPPGATACCPISCGAMTRT